MYLEFQYAGVEEFKTKMTIAYNIAAVLKKKDNIHKDGQRSSPADGLPWPM